MIEPTLVMKNGAVWADSRNVAEVFGREHKNVLRDIDAILESGGSDLSDLWFQEVSSFHAVANKNVRHFEMTKDGFTLLAMGYTGSKAMAFKVAYINRFNELLFDLSRPWTALPP